MSEKAQARIESQLDGNKELSDNGSNTDEVQIPNQGLDREEVLEVEGVTDVVSEGNQFSVYLSYDVNRHITST